MPLSSEVLIAVAPLAMYLVLLGLLNLRKRPHVLTGSREIMLVGLALSGLVAIGPMQLFFPMNAANEFGTYVWVLLFIFYILLLLLWVLISRPRLIVYNVASPQLRAVLSDVAMKLDSEARWAGDCLALPQLNVQLHLESFGFMRNVCLVSTGAEPSFTNWRRLEELLRGALKQVEVSRSPRGYTFLVVGLLFATGLLFNVVKHPQTVAQGLIQIFRL